MRRLRKSKHVKKALLNFQGFRAHVGTDNCLLLTSSQVLATDIAGPLTRAIINIRNRKMNDGSRWTRKIGSTDFFKTGHRKAFLETCCIKSYKFNLGEERNAMTFDAS